MVVAEKWRLDERLMMRMVEVMWAGQVVNRMLLDVDRYLRRDRNVLFCHVKLETVAGGKNFSALDALERRDRSALVEVNFPLMHHHVAVSGESFVAYITLRFREKARLKSRSTSSGSSTHLIILNARVSGEMPREI